MRPRWTRDQRNGFPQKKQKRFSAFTRVPQFGQRFFVGAAGGGGAAGGATWGGGGRTNSTGGGGAALV